MKYRSQLVNIKDEIQEISKVQIDLKIGMVAILENANILHAQYAHLADALIENIDDMKCKRQEEDSHSNERMAAKNAELAEVSVCLTKADIKLSEFSEM